MWLITNQWSSLELATRGVNVIFTISSAFSFLKAPKAVKIKYLLKHYYKWVLKLGMLVYKDHHFIMSVKAIVGGSRYLHLLLSSVKFRWHLYWPWFSRLQSAARGSLHRAAKGLLNHQHLFEWWHLRSGGGQENDKFTITLNSTIRCFSRIVVKVRSMRH